MTWNSPDTKLMEDSIRSGKTAAEKAVPQMWIQHGRLSAESRDIHGIKVAFSADILPVVPGTS
jgi:hypothetical protein